MFRNRSHGSALQRLAALPTGTHVLMRFGAVYVRMVRRWLPAGIICKPLTSKALLRLNGGAFPTVLVAAAVPS
jgi:hypothetical protein